jgi:hypothetical protein
MIPLFEQVKAVHALDGEANVIDFCLMYDAASRLHSQTVSFWNSISVKKELWLNGDVIPAFADGTEKNHDMTQSRWPVFRPRFEPSSSRMLPRALSLYQSLLCDK